jgi:hypothetical protein
MDLSIRVIAFNTFCDRSRFASRHPHLSVVQVFKDRFAAPFRLIRQQQRGEIMKNLPNFVKHFAQLFLIFPLPLHHRKTPAPQRAAHYIHNKITVNQLWKILSTKSKKQQIDPPAFIG